MNHNLTSISKNPAESIDTHCKLETYIQKQSISDVHFALAENATAVIVKKIAGQDFQMFRSNFRLCFKIENTSHKSFETRHC